jgi:hypothetical protein
MTENQFLELATYSINTIKNELIVWWENQIVATLDFSETPEKLQDDKYCFNLAEEVVLESSLYDKFVKEKYENS